MNYSLVCCQNVWTMANSSGSFTTKIALFLAKKRYFRRTRLTHHLHRKMLTDFSFSIKNMNFGVYCVKGISENCKISCFTFLVSISQEKKSKWALFMLCLNNNNVKKKINCFHSCGKWGHWLFVLISMFEVIK